MLKALRGYPEGITLIDLLAKLRSGSFAERANKNPNGIYNASTKLERAGEVVKYKGRVFLPSHYEEFRERVRKGEVEDYKGSGEKTVADLLVEFIDSQPQGVEAGDIVEHMTGNEIIQSPGSVYNNLSKIVARGKVRRSGKLYLPKNSEAPPAEAGDASETTPGGAGTPGTGES